jgi:hypothetical protein
MLTSSVVFSATLQSHHRLNGGNGNRRFGHRKHGTYVFAHLNLPKQWVTTVLRIASFVPIGEGTIAVEVVSLIRRNLYGCATFPLERGKAIMGNKYN